MSIEIALSLFAASVPLAALGVKLISMVDPVDFVRLETEFDLFTREVRKDLEDLKQTLEKKNVE